MNQEERWVLIEKRDMKKGVIERVSSEYWVVGPAGFEPTTFTRKSDPSRSVSISLSDSFFMPILPLAST